MLCRARIAAVAATVAALCTMAAAVEAPDAGRAPDANPAAGAAAPAPAPGGRLTVSKAFIVANGSMLQVRFNVPPSKTTQWIPVDPKDTYVVDEANGEKFFVANLVRIGPAAQVRMPKGGGSTYMVIDNRHEHLKPGALITVVVGGLKQEHVMVAEQ
jgi:hypothetical protein